MVHFLRCFITGESMVLGRVEHHVVRYELQVRFSVLQTPKLHVIVILEVIHFATA